MCLRTAGQCLKKVRLTRSRPQSRLGTNDLELESNNMCLCPAVQCLKKVRLTRSRPQSRLGDKLFGIRVKYVFMCSSAVFKKDTVNPFKSAVPFRGQTTWN